MKAVNPTLQANPGDVLKLPVCNLKNKENVQEIINISKIDWDSKEYSAEYKTNLILSHHKNNIISSVNSIVNSYEDKLSTATILEKEINKEIADYFSFPASIVNDLEITLNCNLEYKYGKDTSKEERLKKLYTELISDLLSHSIGCQMGRYSLDREGLVYAHEGNKGFADLVAEGAYKTFPADSDGILPLMDDEWFEDDVTSRVKEFVRTVWGEEHLQENLEFIAESLCLYAIKPKKGESALETIRRYLSTQFWKDHMKMYKKRPIYWLFSSGKEKAFECLVYLHRYNDATLSRMRTEYVVPLLARYQANIDRLNDQLDEASGGEATRLKRERDSLIKKFSELRSYDDRLRHYADMRISIDLDDGVKVNYGKFGDLLADVKAITGNAPEVI